MIKNRNAKVTLVGAGPGDPDLISVAGVKALKKANVILYDALVNEDVLDWAPSNSIKIFVGKRKGYKRYQQNEINYLLVANAIEHGHVVRLKGGDPFVFGRGAEELDFVHSFGIPTVTIPGISSSTSAMATQGIPLTKRGVSEGFWVITGTTKNGTISKDIILAVQSTSTIVILMGMTNLPFIVDAYKQQGKEDQAIAIIQNAYLPNQASAVGTMDTIIEEVKQKQIKNPAVIVIGEVVKHGTKTIDYFLASNQILSV